MSENTTPKTTYSFVHTYGVDGKITDTRVCDLSNPMARKWLMNHHWWALNQGFMVGLVVATEDDHNRFQLERLASKFNKVG